MARIAAYQVYRVVFVIIGVLIAAAIVITVITLLHNRGEQVRRDQASQIADQELKQQQSEQKSSSSSSSSSSNANTATPAPEVATTTPTPATTGELPVTGMSDTLAPLFVLGVVSFTTASYIVSRRKLKLL